MRVLLVDPCAETRRSLLQAMRLENSFEWIGQAENVGEALDMLSRERADALITELAMPRADGFELLARLASGSFGSVKAFVLAWRCEPDDARRALSLGARYVMQKPVDPALLIRRVREVAGESGRAPTESVLPVKPLFLQPALLHEIEITLLALGLPANRLGFQYLRDATVIALQDRDTLKAPRDVLYVEVARRCGTVASLVDRCVRRAVDLVWARADVSAMRQSLGDPPPKGADWRFCGAFIGYLADQTQGKATL